MPTALENARTRRDAILTELAALTSSAAGGKPNTSGTPGATVDHVGYKDGLYRELRELLTLFPTLQAEINEDELSFEVIEQGLI